SMWVRSVVRSSASGPHSACTRPTAASKERPRSRARSTGDNREEALAAGGFAGGIVTGAAAGTTAAGAASTGADEDRPCHRPRPAMTAGALDVAGQERTVADEVDEPRHSARALVHHRQRAGRERDLAFAARHAQPM